MTRDEERQPKMVQKKEVDRVIAAVSAYADSRDARIAELEAARRTMTDAQIKHMVDRFLMWKLPEHFRPDGGISFDPIASKGTQHEFRREPVGTNLLTADQAAAMVRHMIDGLPQE